MCAWRWAQHYPSVRSQAGADGVYAEYELENLLTNVVNQAQQGGKVCLTACQWTRICSTSSRARCQGERADESGGERPGAAGATAVRPLLARYARLFAPGLHVLSITKCRMSWS